MSYQLRLHRVYHVTSIGTFRTVALDQFVRLRGLRRPATPQPRRRTGEFCAPWRHGGGRSFLSALPASR